jgi:hypothetical protein
LTGGNPPGPLAPPSVLGSPKPGSAKACAIATPERPANAGAHVCNTAQHGSTAAASQKIAQARQCIRVTFYLKRADEAWG